LMLLIDARRQARAGGSGEMIRLADQNRALWNHGSIREGQSLVRECLHRNRPGPYQIQAAINAVHSDAATPDTTDWRQILALYNQLLAIAPSPVIALNRAVALAEVDGPEAALDAVNALSIDNYYLLHAVRADLLRRLGRMGEAAGAYEAAIARCDNRTERDFLQNQLRQVRQAQ
jgi:RNA polymerase sigma-70 factor, ECF subfamily